MNATLCDPDQHDTIGRVLSNLRPARAAADTGQTLAERLAHFKVPGVSMAVADAGRLAWAHGAGFSAADIGDPVTPSTRFQSASISKPIVATALLRLVDEGRLTLDGPVNDHLRSWKLPESDYTAMEPVTLRRILSHAAGLTVGGFPGYEPSLPLPTVVQILDGTAPANSPAVRVDAVPGTLSRYSGGGTTIAQLAMTDATGESFPGLMQRLVLKPLGMHRSSFDQPLPFGEKAHAAAGHDADGKVLPGRCRVHPELAAAGLWSTPSDLLAWSLEIALAHAGRSNRLLPRRWVCEMLTVQQAPFGLGPVLLGSGAGFHFEHNGSNEGFRCLLTHYPHTGQGAVIMSNGEGGMPLCLEILNAIADEYHWPAA